MFINSMSFIDDLGNKELPKSLNNESLFKVYKQNKGIFSSKTNLPIYQKFNNYFEESSKFDIVLHSSANPYGRIYHTLLDENRTEIHLYTNDINLPLICLTPWMLVHRCSHIFQFSKVKHFKQEVTFLLEKYIEVLTKMFQCINFSNIFYREDEVEYIAEIEEFINYNDFTLLNIFPDNIKKLNKMFLKGKAARTYTKLSSSDIFSEMVSAHHFGKGKFSFVDQNDISDELLKVNKHTYLSTVLEVEKSITSIIDLLLTKQSANISYNF